MSSEDRFYMPAKVFFGKGVVENHAADIGRLGRKALIVTGRHSAKACGVYDNIVKALDLSGTEHVWFHEVEENPSVETVMKARDFALEEKADFVIGAGGGSPMDASKAIALMMYHPEKGAEYLYQPGNDAHTVPVVCIPTTCGTGSEVTAVSVLTNNALQTKKSIPYKIFPELSLIDGTYLRSAGRQTICNTAFDALAHLYESYLNSSATEISKLIARSGLGVWKNCLPVLRGERTAEDEDYENLMRASMLGGMAIAHTGTSLPHGLSYSLTYHLKVAHGRAVCFFMAGYLKEADPKEARHILELSGFSDADDFHRAYLKCCKAPDADRQKMTEILEQCVADLSKDRAKCAKAPFETDEEVLRRIALGAL